jgi:hypothetical protein
VERFLDTALAFAVRVGRGQEEHADAEQVFVFKPDAEFGGFAGEQSARDLGQDAGAVAALAVGRDGTPVAEVGDRFDRLGDDIVARLSAQAGDKPNTAGVVLEARVV